MFSLVWELNMLQLSPSLTSTVSSTESFFGLTVPLTWAVVFSTALGASIVTVGASVAFGGLKVSSADTDRSPLVVFSATRRTFQSIFPLTFVALYSTGCGRLSAGRLKMGDRKRRLFGSPNDLPASLAST